MIVVHACWSPYGLRLWGESSYRPALAPRRGGRPARKPRPRAHPFALDYWSLRDALTDLGPVDERSHAAELVLRLPSHPRGPEASPRLVRARHEPDVEDPSETASWTLRGVAMELDASLDFLLALPAAPPEGVAVADSLRCLGEVAKLALELVARGHVLPVLEGGGISWEAAWRPVLTDDGDAERLAVLRLAMPGAVLAAEPETAPTVDGLDVAGGALDALVDTCVRQALREQRLMPARRGTRTPAEKWLAALLEKQWLRGAELAPLHEALAAWSRPAAPATQGGLRTCFRLSPPGERPDDAGGPDPASGNGAGPGDAPAPDSWRLDFLLQATDDPSLLVPAEEVWRAGGTLTVLSRTLDQPQERLLGDLGRALRLFPPLEPALRGARPTGADLDAAAAHRFLREGAPLLAQAGFGVRVPAWWTRPAARLGVRLQARASASAAGNEGDGRFGLDTLVAYDWRVSIGEQSVSAEEFRALAAAKVPLVKFRGEWVELKPGEAEAALRLLERGDSGRMTAAEALRLGMGGGEAVPELPVVGFEAEGWLGELLAGAGDARLKPARTPAGFAGKLRPYQKRGLAWLAFLDRLGLGACLADDMGLGKTVQLLALLLAEPVETGSGRRRRRLPTLLVCPMSVVGNWQREAARFAPGLRVHVHHGGERLGGRELRRAVRDSDLVITTYALAARDREELDAVEWGRVVLDEAQNIKNSAAKQTQAVRSLRAPRRIALTGTPVENRLAELWSILEFLNPGLLGSAAEFRRSFAVPIERFHDADRAAQLRRLTGPFVLRRLKTDRNIIRDLPAKNEMKVFCNLTREQATLYQAVVDEMMQRVEASTGMERRGLVLSTLLRLKQVCNHPAQLLKDGSAIPGRSGKLARLEETLEEVLEVGDRALVFTQFAEMGQMLRAHLEARFGREVPFLYGGTSKPARDALVERFQSADGPPVLLVSLKAGGTGLNLTAANHVIHFDRWWNPAVEDQATDRAFRIGQRRDVQVRKLVCAGTLEERIDAMIEEKKALAESVLGAGEAWLTELSTDELRRVIALAADAVAE
ncbi:MAG TPA: DEAD/DEAH box helicase [Longimicrobiaceae bacterium]